MSSQQASATSQLFRKIVKDIQDLGAVRYAPQQAIEHIRGLEEKLERAKYLDVLEEWKKIWSPRFPTERGKVYEMLRKVEYTLTPDMASIYDHHEPRTIRESRKRYINFELDFLACLENPLIRRAAEEEEKIRAGPMTVTVQEYKAELETIYHEDERDFQVRLRWMRHESHEERRLGRQEHEGQPIPAGEPQWWQSAVPWYVPPANAPLSEETIQLFENANTWLDRAATWMSKNDVD
ncbi:MAG: hypothetical protein L6R35_005754 [Caloplaca aegaea]|nr:MAG: hypothetical protein L6R35_005754 [Caloplaca aegaea]